MSYININIKLVWDFLIISNDCKSLTSWARYTYEVIPWLPCTGSETLTDSCPVKELTPIMPVWPEPESWLWPRGTLYRASAMSAARFRMISYKTNKEHGGCSHTQLLRFSLETFELLILSPHSSCYFHYWLLDVTHYFKCFHVIPGCCGVNRRELLQGLLLFSGSLPKKHTIKCSSMILGQKTRAIKITIQLLHVHKDTRNMHQSA